MSNKKVFSLINESDYWDPEKVIILPLKDFTEKLKIEDERLLKKLKKWSSPSLYYKSGDDSYSYTDCLQFRYIENPRSSSKRTKLNFDESLEFII